MKSNLININFKNESEINIVEATKFDISELLRMAWNGWKEMELFRKGVEWDVEAVSKLMLGIMEDRQSGAIFVAEHPVKERKIVGRIMVIRNCLFHSPSVPIAHVLGLNVDKKFRGQSIGAKLTERAVEWAKEQGIKMFVIHHRTSSGEKVKESLEARGFEPLETMYYKVIDKNG